MIPDDILGTKKVVISPPQPQLSVFEIEAKTQELPIGLKTLWLEDVFRRLSLPKNLIPTELNMKYFIFIKDGNKTNIYCADSKVNYADKTDIMSNSCFLSSIKEGNAMKRSQSKKPNTKEPTSVMSSTPTSNKNANKASLSSTKEVLKTLQSNVVTTGSVITTAGNEDAKERQKHPFFERKIFSSGTLEGETDEEDGPEMLSDETPVTGKNSEIFASATVTKKCEIAFRIGSERPDTNLNGQGDHITSYVAIIKAILASTNETTILDAIYKIKCFLEKVLGKKIPDIHTQQTKPLYEPYYRESLVGKLGDSFSEKEKKFINDAVKYTKVSLLATGLADLVSYGLREIQNDPLAAVFSEGRINKNTSEGSSTRDAARALTALDRLCQIETLSNNKLLEQSEEIITSLLSKKRAVNPGEEKEEDPVILYGLNKFLDRLFNLHILDQKELTNEELMAKLFTTLGDSYYYIPVIFENACFFEARGSNCVS